MVTPQRKLPLSGSSSPARVWNRVVLARLLPPTKAILSPLRTVRLRSFSTERPSTALVRLVISRIMSPHGRSGLKATCGYFLEETGISSSVSFSRSFLREVACFALEALELKRWMNSFSSLALSVILRFSSCFCLNAIWLA